jgi:hypothetical protein
VRVLEQFVLTLQQEAVSSVARNAAVGIKAGSQLSGLVDKDIAVNYPGTESFEAMAIEPSDLK